MEELKNGMVLVVYPDYAVAGAEGTFQISSINDNEGNDLQIITDFLTANGYYDYHLEGARYVTQIKNQLREAYNENLVNSLQIELGE